MRVDLFDFELPEELIALRPARPRESARLLHVRADGVFEDRVVRDAPALFRPGDVLVFNDTRVIPARLAGVRVRDEFERHGGGDSAEAPLAVVVDGSSQAGQAPARRRSHPLRHAR